MEVLNCEVEGHYPNKNNRGRSQSPISHSYKFKSPHYTRRMVKTIEKIIIVILLWTLYYTKHRNWFHESLVMLEIFTKLPLNNLKFWFLYRQAVRNSLISEQGQGKNKKNACC